MAPEQKKNLPLDVHWLSGFLSVSGAQQQHPTATSRRQKTLQHVFPVALFSLSLLSISHTLAAAELRVSQSPSGALRSPHVSPQVCVQPKDA